MFLADALLHISSSASPFIWSAHAYLEGEFDWERVALCQFCAFVFLTQKTTFTAAAAARAIAVRWTEMYTRENTWACYHRWSVTAFCITRTYMLSWWLFKKYKSQLIASWAEASSFIAELIEIQTKRKKKYIPKRYCFQVLFICTTAAVLPLLSVLQFLCCQLIDVLWRKMLALEE